MLELVVNGEARQVAEGTTVAGLLGILGIQPDQAAVERNGAVVLRRHHGEEPLRAGDVIEVLTFVGGG